MKRVTDALVRLWCDTCRKGQGREVSYKVKKTPCELRDSQGVWRLLISCNRISDRIFGEKFLQEGSVGYV